MARHTLTGCVIVVALAGLSSAVYAQEPEPTVEELVGRLCRPAEPYVHNEAVKALGALGAEAVAPLAEHLDEADPLARRQVVRALEATKAAEALPHLVHALEDPDLDVRRQAASALPQFGLAGLDAVLAVLEDPDTCLQRTAGDLDIFAPAFPVEKAPIVTLGPLSARVNAGLLLTPEGEVPPPYTLRGTVAGDEKVWEHLSINGVVLEARRHRFAEAKDAEKYAWGLVRQYSDILATGGVVCLWDPESPVRAKSASVWRYVLRRARESDRSDVQKASLLLGVGWFRGNWRFAARAALGPEADEETVVELVERMHTQMPVFDMTVWPKAVGLKASSVTLGYCIRKFQRRLGVEIRCDPDLARRNVRVKVQGSQEIFLLSFADQAGAKLSKEAGAYMLSPLPVTKLREPETWEVVWRKVCPWAFLPSPAVAEGKVIIMMQFRVLSALELESGRSLWEARIPHSQSESTPVVVGPIAYAGGDDNDMFAVRVEDGKVLWRYQAPTTQPGGGELVAWSVTPLGVHGMAALFRSGDGNVYAVHRSKGRRLWTLRPPVGYKGLLADGVLYLVGERGVCAADVTTRRIIWHKPMEGLAAVPPSKSGERLFVSGKGRVSALSAVDGRVLWQCDTQRRGRMNQPTRIIEGKLIVTGGRGDITVYALDPADGTILWRTLLGGCPYRFAPDGQGRIMVGMEDGRLCLVDAATGRLLEERQLGVDYVGPVLAGDLILITSHDPKAGGRHGRGVLTAYRPAGD